MTGGPIRRIVVGVGGSKGSEQAPCWTIRLAESVDAEVFAVNAHAPAAYVARPGAAP